MTRTDTPLDGQQRPITSTQAQPRDRKRPDTSDGSSQPGLIQQMTAFKTDVPSRPIDVVLARPTQDSVTVSVVCYDKEPCEGYIEYRRDDSSPITKTRIQPLPAGSAVLFSLSRLNADTGYVYRVRYRRIAGAAEPAARPGDAPAPSAFISSEYFAFHTPRARGAPFTFTIQADSHLDQGVEPKVYQQTLANMLAAQPDFVVDLGDTFMTDKRGQDFKSALAQYDAQRYYFSRVAHSAPLFMVLGNHDGEKGTSGRDAEDIGPWSYRQRVARFPEPLIDGTMYTGSTAMTGGIGSNYYAFEWGDALFVVLDPYWFTTERIRGGGGGGGGGNRAGGGQKDPGGAGGQRPGDEPLKPIDSSWVATLGRAQYDWLAQTLANTKAKYRFVFTHHLVGGLGGAESRGGAESSPFFEWGGRNADGSAGFATHRAGWPMPIHDLFVKHRVSAVFHGHDHLYVRSERDGVVYQCVPQPGNLRGNTRTAVPYGYASGTILGSPGHVRVRVGPEKATVEFIRTGQPEGVDMPAGGGRRGDVAREPNGAVVHTYELSPVDAAPTPRTTK